MLHPEPFTALMVISTALGPALSGFLPDASLNFEQTFNVAAAYLLLTTGWNFRIKRKAEGETAKKFSFPKRWVPVK